MSHDLRFRSRLIYDPGRAGIEVPVQLTIGSARADVVAKLNTGASLCVFRRAIAEALDLDLEAGRRVRIGTVAGSFLAYGHAVTLRAVEIELDAMVYFAADEAVSRNVLGRKGWIERVRLGLVDYDGLLYVSHYDEEGWGGECTRPRAHARFTFS